MRLLALDVGNGSVKYGRFEGGRRVAGGRLPLEEGFDRLRSERAAVDRAVAVSVNPPVLAKLRDLLRGLEAVGVEVPVPLPVLYEPPEACGLDRVMGVLGALARRPDAAGVLVLDAGTCLTATVGVRGRGVLGGAILPGPDLMARSLAEGTAALPRVAPGPSPEGWGRSTEDSIRVGIDAAVAGACRELVRRCRAHRGVPLGVVAAGTGAGALAAAVPEIDAAHPFATLWGVHEAAAAV